MFEFEGETIRFEQVHITFDRMDDVLESLNTFIASIERSMINHEAWKFAIISAHNALQGAICIALRGTNSFATWKPKHLEKWINKYRHDVDVLPSPHLDYFLELFDKLFSETPNIKRSDVEWLNDVRNNLTHFNTGSYSICQHSAFVCCWTALEAIQIAPTLQTVNYIRHDRLTELARKVEESQLVMRKYIEEKST